MNWFVWQIIVVVASAIAGGVITWFLLLKGVLQKAQNRIIEGHGTDDVAKVLEVLATGGIIVGPTNVISRATLQAMAMGLVQNRRLVHQQLAELVDRARISEKPEDASLELSTGLAGNTLVVEARAGSIGDGNVLLLVEDRTDAKRLGEARRDFVANISHELKTPVGAIILLTEAIAGAAGDPETIAKFAKSLNRESQRLSSLVQDIIQLSKLQGGVEQAQHIKVNLSDVVEDAISRNTILAETKQVTIRHDASAEVWILGDCEMLTSAVKNLIENAIIYSPSGSWVGVGLRENDGVAEISVTDHGVGIAAADQERVFERFYRVDDSRSRETGGTGIGLAIVKHVAANHQGEVKLFSQLGLGSTFTLRLPVADDALATEGMQDLIEEIIEKGRK